MQTTRKFTSTGEVSSHTITTMKKQKITWNYAKLYHNKKIRRGQLFQSQLNFQSIFCGQQNMRNIMHAIINLYTIWKKMLWLKHNSQPSRCSLVWKMGLRKLLGGPGYYFQNGRFIANQYLQLKYESFKRSFQI